MTVDSSAATFSVLEKFAIEGELQEVCPHSRGHIHSTFISTWRAPGGTDAGPFERFLHQKLNDRVFENIPGLMHNIERVTEHLRVKREGQGHGCTLSLVPTREGMTYYRGKEGSWRTYHYIENTDSYDICANENQAFEAARMFGEFQADLSDLDASSLVETIPHFFSTPYRWEQFESAKQKNVGGRVACAAAEIAFAAERHDMVDVIAGHQRAGRIPGRVVHGDTKLNNVLFDITSARAVCIVDLDTCMPGYSLYDFGDLVRFTAAMCREDETDLSKVGMSLELYRALVSGYLQGAGGFLNSLERELMPFAARLVTFTIGLRFLSDYLSGDVYFKTDYPEHNLDRARVQFAMVESMEKQREAMTRAS